MKERIKETIADLLNEIGCAAVAHKGRPRMAPNHRAREGRRNVVAPPPRFGGVHSLIDTAKKHHGRRLVDRIAHRGVIGLLPRTAHKAEGAGHAELVFQEAP